jgi:hypothetical protein
VASDTNLGILILPTLGFTTPRVKLNKTLQYYGVEQTNRKQCEELKGTPGEPIPLYQKGAYRYTLKDGEDEAKVREEISKALSFLR